MIDTFGFDDPSWGYTQEEWEGEEIEFDFDDEDQDESLKQEEIYDPEDYFRFR